MGKVYDALHALAPVQDSPVQDTEVLDGFRRYEALLETVLTPEQMALYADYLQQAKVVRIFDEMEIDEIAALPPGMGAIVTRVLANTNLSMENRRVVALLSQAGEQAATPDYQRA